MSPGPGSGADARKIISDFGHAARLQSICRYILLAGEAGTTLDESDLPALHAAIAALAPKEG